jgi:hypothetical protein
MSSALGTLSLMPAGGFDLETMGLMVWGVSRKTLWWNRLTLFWSYSLDSELTLFVGGDGGDELPFVHSESEHLELGEDAGLCCAEEFFDVGGGFHGVVE